MQHAAIHTIKREPPCSNAHLMSFSSSVIIGMMSLRSPDEKSNLVNGLVKVIFLTNTVAAIRDPSTASTACRQHGDDSTIVARHR
jgi:hypothetical protein